MRNFGASEFPWRGGNRVALLENGEEFFMRAFALIDAAQREILIETFILFEDKIGLELHRRLIAAARRGVRVELTVDGYGSPHFSPEFLAGFTDAGVRLRLFDPHPRWLGVRLHAFRRMHRKLLVADARVALVGGINFSADHVRDFGAEAKQDYAVEVEGPAVADIHDFLRAALASQGVGNAWRPARQAESVAQAGATDVMFVPRDNHRRRGSIEREYRRAIRAARREILLANAYFFPGYGFLRDLRHAARRGVKVTLIFQGEPDMQVALVAARTLYRYLIEAGVQLHEYCERPFHGKVALVDDDWATVGSSNLDPLSLSLNLEANVFIRDPSFVAELRNNLQHLLQHHCQSVDPAQVPRGRFWHVLTRPLLFHVLRRFPDWAGWLPAHTPRVALAKPPPDEAGAGTTPP
ncbi:cardiolipin synthase [Lysobacter niabensis]|uniref:Cardiolipin synthase B n=1 Tax=Agrilutibacter niabensis TaxID=380628 RepID=A0ABU1VQ43_9GAMM|nr:cardiolipin synthase ClsB [Lysobacter niabensis]MDR7099611.1 cardiolipin synthase [Lysobacter niabensis]